MNAGELKVICVDMDGCISFGDTYSVKQVREARPNVKFIRHVNMLSRKNFIVIYTARRDHLLCETMRWLRLNGVTFHAITNNKCPSDVYIDDRAVNIKDVKM